MSAPNIARCAIEGARAFNLMGYGFRRQEHHSHNEKTSQYFRLYMVFHFILDFMSVSYLLMSFPTRYSLLDVRCAAFL